MNPVTIVVLAITILLTVYLVATLLFPEKF